VPAVVVAPLRSKTAGITRVRLAGADPSFVEAVVVCGVPTYNVEPRAAGMCVCSELATPTSCVRFGLELLATSTSLF